MTRLFALLLLCLVVGGGSYLLIDGIKPQGKLLDYFPADTLALVEWENLDHSWERLRYSLKGEKQQPTFYQILDQLGVPEPLLDDAKKGAVFFDQYAKLVPLHSLCNTNAALALLPVTAGQPPASVAWPKQLVLALQVKPDFFSQQLHEVLGSVQSQQTTVYQGEPLVTLVFSDGGTLSYWLQGNILICAQEAALVHRCIDQSGQRMVRPRSGLQLNEGYQRLKRQSRTSTDFFCYVDLERLRLLLPGLREIDAETSEFLPRQLALFHLAEEEKDRLGIIALASKEALTAFTTQHHLAPPVQGPAFRLVSRETGFSLWTNWFKPKKLWDLCLQRSNPDVVALMTSADEQLSELTGKSLDAFFDVFGDGFGVFINEETVPRQSDRSMGGLIVEMRDRVAVETMIKQLVDGLQVITVKSGGIEISSVMLAGGLLQPAFALVDNHLILADSVELIEQLRQEVRYEPSGKEHASQRGGGEAGNLFMFVRTGEMIERLSPLLTLMAKETNEQNRMLSAESRLFVREVGLPLLTRLRTIATTRLRGYAVNGTILIEADFTLRRE